MKRRVVAVVQARMGSQRFPGKMTQRLGKHRMIEWVLLRTLRAQRLNAVVLATSVSEQNSVLRDVAAELSVPVVAGSENDVLARFLCASERFQADDVVRVCADNPFIDPVEIDRLVASYLATLPDYAYNHVPGQNNNYPDGLGAEIMSAAVLNEIAAAAVDARHREHVTLYIWDHRERYRIQTLQAPQEIAFPDVKLDVDTPADLERLQRIVSDLDITSSAQSVVDAYRAIYSTQ